MKTQVISFTTPKGIAQYPYLSKPDVKFNPEGDYKVNLEVPKKEAEDLIEKLIEIRDEFIEEADNVQKVIRSGKRILKADLFEEDDDGNVIFKFKQKAVITKKNGDKINVKIAHFDAKGKPCTGVNIGGGSVIRVNFTVMPYYMPSTKMVGLSLRPVAVQVIDLKEWGGHDAKSYGFGEEEGYEADQDDTFPSGEVSAEDLEEDKLDF